MAPEQARPLILTAKLDDEAQATFDRLREQHFPPERNMIPAHLSLFNQLPGERRESLCRDIEEACAAQKPIAARVDGLRFLGKGVAYTLDAPGLEGFRRELAGLWEPWLGPQDAQKLSAHITVQNKVPPETAKALYSHLEANFSPMEAAVEGVSLWRYLGGPWEPVRESRFLG